MAGTWLEEGLTRRGGQGKGGKLANVIGYRVRVSINDGRQFAGLLLAFDKHMNLVISECEEFRRVKAQKAKALTGADEGEEMKRVLGLVILRGEHVVSITVEGPPPAQEQARGPGLTAGPGSAAAAGRGIPLNPTMSVSLTFLSRSVRPFYADVFWNNKAHGTYGSAASSDGHGTSAWLWCVLLSYRPSARADLDRPKAPPPGFPGFASLSCQ